MATKKKDPTKKVELSVTRSRIKYYVTDKKRNGHLWDEKFLKFVDSRIADLKNEEAELMRGLGYV